MRKLIVVACSVLAGCASAAQPGPEAAATPSEPTAPSAGGPAATAAATSAPVSETPAPTTPPEPVADKVELTRGERIDSHGVRLMLRGTGVEHRKDGSTLLKAELEVRKGDEESKVALERALPGDAKFLEVLGLQVALESVDAARKPSTAQLLVRP